MTTAPALGWLDGLQEAVWLVDETHLLILHANAAAARLAGAPVHAMVGASVLSLASTPQDIAFWGEPAQVVADGIHSHTLLLRADGSLVPVNRQVPVYNEDGSIKLQTAQKTFESQRYGRVAGALAGGVIGAGVGLAAGVSLGLADKLLTEAIAKN